MSMSASIKCYNDYRYNEYCTGRMPRRPAGLSLGTDLLDEPAQIPELAIAHMPHEPGMQVVHDIVERHQQLEAGGGDSGAHHAAITVVAAALNEPAPLQSIQKPSHVGIPLDQPLDDLAAGRTLRPGPAQDSEHVVLREREVHGLHDP